MAFVGIGQIIATAIPELAAAAAAIGYALYGHQSESTIRNLLSQYTTADSSGKISLLTELGLSLDAAFATTELRDRLAEYGLSAAEIRIQMAIAIAKAIENLKKPYTFPSFSTTAAAHSWWDALYSYYVAGSVTLDYYNAARLWYTQEISRLSAAQPTLPAPVAPTIPGAKYYPGQALQITFFGGVGTWLVLSVDMSKAEPWYHLRNTATGVETDANETFLVGTATVVPTPAVAPTVTPTWTVGQLLSLPGGLVYQITSVEILDQAPMYTMIRSDTGQQVRLPEGVLINAGASLVTATPTTGVIPSTTVVIPGFGTAQVSVSVQGQPITGAIPGAAPQAAIATLDPAVIAQLQAIAQAAAASAAASRSSAEAAQAQAGAMTGLLERPVATPNVYNNIDTGMLGMGIASIPIGLVSALTAVSGGTWGNISHNMALGRNTCYGSTTAALLQNMLPTALGIFSMAALQSDVGIGGWISDRATDWIDGHVDPRKYKHVDTIDDLVTNASKRLREAITFGLQAHMWAVTAESNFVLKNLGLGQVAGVMADMADFKRISQATIGAVEQAALSTPAKLLANYQLRPNIPGMGDLEEMYAKKEIPLSAPVGKLSLSQALALQGFSDDWIKVYSEHLWKDPRLGEVIRIGQFFSPALKPELRTAPPNEAQWLAERGVSADIINGPDWYFHWRAMKGGYSPADVSVIAETAKRATARREQTLFLDGVTRMCRDGYITLARARELINDAWAMSNPIEARLIAIDLQRDYRLLQDTKSIIIMSMARGLITRAEAREQLGNLGLDGQRVEIEVLKGTLGMLPGMRLEISRPEEVLEEAGMEAE